MLFKNGFIAYQNSWEKISVSKLGFIDINTGILKKFLLF